MTVIIPLILKSLIKLEIQTSLISSIPYKKNCVIANKYGVFVSYTQYVLIDRLNGKISKFWAINGTLV